ncbi:aldehyde dehydrogenase [Sutcliffiella horikoshii]|uniref:Aldehyde dehydrogenase n=1 Tax=Sutcliffiella horikoshii TaxID=79883 RepID=A0A5D4T0F1_9BACI|nr:aldehyde dehydrogenase [Sutcliffiella horikoshii]TYS67586.1 aldehyde dehydrogenase [Sutcliffiella horikoshii]
MTTATTNINETVEKLLANHRSYFEKGETKDIEFRLKQLATLKKAVQKYEAEFMDALKKDLGKSIFEAYGSEVGYILDSIGFFMKNLKSWAKVKKVRTPLVHTGSKSLIYSQPYGTVLIVGPFNYPVQLVLEPLIGAISAGNCAVIKPSEFTPTVSSVLSKMIGEFFNKEYISVVEGEKEETSALIHAPFDYIFFTGSVEVGKIVMQAAAQRLVPVTLELGGKSPCIVHKDANIEVAAQRIAWGKFMNAGQTCVAPDYLLVHKDVREKLVKALKKTIHDFYGDNPQQSKDYGRVVNERQFDRLASLVDKEKVVVGGRLDREDLYMDPTVMDGVSWEDGVMKDEIFGPILPVLEYQDLNDAMRQINNYPKPLALYVFTENSDVEEQVIEGTSFGGGCVNDTVTHLTNPYLPFGGVGSSGIGSYHGKDSFDTFSHKKSVMKKSTKFNLSFLYPPYSDKSIKMLKKFMK